MAISVGIYSIEGPDVGFMRVGGGSIVAVCAYMLILYIDTYIHVNYISIYVIPIDTELIKYLYIYVYVNLRTERRHPKALNLSAARPPPTAAAGGQHPEPGVLGWTAGRSGELEGTVGCGVGDQLPHVHICIYAHIYNVFVYTYTYI